MPRLPKPNLSLSFGRRSSGAGLVGLDIQPGYVAAVQADVNGSIAVRAAAGMPLPPDTIREGEVLDESLLSETLRGLFREGTLEKRVRIGVANQRTVLRMLELPPVTDRKELAAAVRFQAEDQIPMPLSNAVLDFQSLGTYDTPNGERQRVVVVAAQRDMVEKLLSAVRAAGLRPEGVDLSAFALIRSLYRRAGEGEAQGRVLYLNVGGLTNMAIAEGLICRFTRVVGAGLEAMASEIAERRGIPLVEAREMLAAIDLRPDEPEPVVLPEPEPDPELEREPVVRAEDAAEDFAPDEDEDEDEDDGEPEVAFHEGFGAPPEPEPIETWALAQGAPAEDDDAEPREAPTAGETTAGGRTVAEPTAGGSTVEEPTAEAPEAETSTVETPTLEAPKPAQAAAAATRSDAGQRSAAPHNPEPSDADVRLVLENGIREIVGDVRNSLDFHRSQDGGGDVQSVVLSGPALAIPGFAEALEADLGLTVRRQSIHIADASVLGGLSPHHLTIAAGLAAEEVHS
jgi:type IV pilus assembly protein PilM